MNYRKIIFKIFFGVFFLTFTSSFLWAGEPGDLIMGSIDRGISILKDPSLQGEEKAEERKQKIWKELSPIFYYEEMSKRVLGKYWRKRTIEEKKEFVGIFTNYLKGLYIGKTYYYSGEKIVYISEKQNGKYSKVQTKVITKKGKEASVEYRLLNNDGKWKIYDVIVEGVSFVNNYRSQYNSVLVRSSYEELIQKIKQKQITSYHLKGKNSLIVLRIYPVFVYQTLSLISLLS